MFGALNSIDAAAFAKLPKAMQCEGVMLMRERGSAVVDIAKHLKLQFMEAALLSNGAPELFRRGGENTEGPSDA